ncbi:MAG: hypothetical protein ACXWZS_01300 [Gemmatirosa sp.]
MPTRSARRGAVRAALLLVATAMPAGLAAQGSLGAQGFGYPTGQLSTRALATGGSIGEFDQNSPLNPAAISYFRRSSLSAQFDPEFRRVTADGASQSATIARFPVISVGLPVRDRLALGLSASTYLDRSFTTTYQTTTSIGDETVTATESIESRGSVADLRVGLGFIATRWLRLGVAGHVLTGENRLISGRLFADTSRFGSVSDSSTLDYSGTAVSGGVEITPLRGLSIAASARRGLDLRVQRNDSTLRESSAPDRVGVGVRFDRITGASFAVGYAHNTWTRMRELGSSALEVHDGAEFMAGVEAVGPRLGDVPVLIRLGGRDRVLPFGLAGAEVKERSYSGGIGLPFAGGRALADLAVQRASRSLSGSVPAGSPLAGGASERAWTISVGFTVRP